MVHNHIEHEGDNDYLNPQISNTKTWLTNDRWNAILIITGFLVILGTKIFNVL